MDKIILESIDEELGISEELTNISDKISNLVLDNVKKQERKKITTGVQTNTFRFSYNVLSDNVNFEIKNNYFSDAKVYLAFRKQYKPKPNKYSAETNTIRIEVNYVNEWHDRERLEGAIQHELEHLYQDIKAGYKKEHTSQYQLASGNYNSTQPDIQLVSRMIYYSEEREIYAFYNQAYQSLMEVGDRFDPRNAISDTKLYKGYELLKRGKDYLLNNTNNGSIDRLLSKFGTTNRKLLEHVEWAIKEYATYIGMAIVKAEKDYKKESIDSGDHYEY